MILETELKIETMTVSLLCTVGTSLFEGNLRHLSDQTLNRPDHWMQIKHAFDTESWTDLAKQLCKVDPASRICGAEINTIEESIRKNNFVIQNLVFLVSDTPSGVSTGMLLKRYFELRTDLESLQSVEYCVVPDLQDTDPKRFRTQGLRNLVQTMGEYINRFGQDRIRIDATGGYKAQIAIALLLGQALDIPVYYKHERFSEIISFPPLPVSLDYSLLEKYSDVLVDLEKGLVLSDSDFEIPDEKLRIFLSEEEVDGVRLYELNAVGMLYLTAFRIRNPKAVLLRNLTEEEREKPSFRDDHYPIGFKSFVNRVWSECTWIKTCTSMDYGKQKSMSGIRFKVVSQQEKFSLIGTYEDKDNFKAPFRIVLSDESEASRIWAVDYLNRKYR